MPRRQDRTYKGKFSPKNWKKYRGDPTNIFFRSGWELRMMRYLDETSTILEWQSEEFFIPYQSPVDNQRHRYFPDFWVKAVGLDGVVKIMVIEVKPAAQTIPPVKNKNNKGLRRFITESATFAVNQAKWQAARFYCQQRGWEFKIFTEHDLKIPK
jgi:hypothetical protein